jgi:hypothetical protein
MLRFESRASNSTKGLIGLYIEMPAQPTNLRTSPQG